MTQLTYYPDPVAETGPVTYECAAPGCANTGPDKHCPSCSARLGLVRHGYTLADLTQLTHGALKADRLMALDYADRSDIAWSAIAERVCTAEIAPTRIELIQVGWQAIARTVRDGLRERGYRDGQGYADGPTAPRFLAYWSGSNVSTLEEKVVERFAVEQVLSTLGEIYRDAITALAMADDYQRGADLLGISYTAFVARVNVARKAIYALWHEGETPYRPRKTDRRVASHTQALATHCGNGHEWTQENTRMGSSGSGVRLRRFCRQCERDRTARRAGAA